MNKSVNRKEDNIMKKSKIVSVIMACILATSAAVSASAATLTNENPDGSTDVTARIEGASPGEVSYTITIPDNVDFGTLTQPETDTDSYKYVNFDVTATELKISDDAFVSVYVNGYKEDDKQFYIAQQNVSNPFEIKYDIYNGEVNDENISSKTALGATDEPSSAGYHFTTFGVKAEGTSEKGTLAINQKALYGKSLDEIAGDYSGTMVFHSSIVTV